MSNCDNSAPINSEVHLTIEKTINLTKLLSSLPGSNIKIMYPTQCLQQCE